ncbi:hypothetical protein ACFSTH_06995 [Paenibacillus yanchengensis]|uniref:DUF4230 domain-containing protein n=1 Tax=Paenibacillus yanchengensis TaxID=2035833 RepID=A0ABW4YHP3_9BACL
MTIRKNIIKIIIILIIIAAIVGWYFYYNPFVKKIDITTTGIQFRNNDPSGYFEEKEITIKGTYEQFLFGNKVDSFWGEFSVEGYDFTFDEKYYTDIFLIPQGGSIQYFTANLTESKRLGVIHSDAYLKELMIVVSSEGLIDYENGIIISAPAKNRAEAVEMAEKLYNKSALSGYYNGWNDWN